MRKRFTKDLQALIFINSLDKKQTENMFIYVDGKAYSIAVCYNEIKAKTELSKKMIEQIV